MGCRSETESKGKINLVTTRFVLASHPIWTRRNVILQVMDGIEWKNIIPSSTLE